MIWPTIAVLIAIAIALLLVVTARTIQVRPSLMTIVLTSIPAPFLVWVSSLNAQWWLAVVLWVLGVSLPGSAANRSWKRDKANTQARRDAAAKAVLWVAAKRGETKVTAFTLYLRPFSALGRLPVQPLPPLPHEMPQHLDLETMMYRAVSPWCPLIGLGLAGDMEGAGASVAPGAGRIVLADDAWRQAVSDMAFHARLLVCIPSYHPGTLWELAWIKEQAYFDKTLFVMPESMKQAQLSGSTTYETEDIFPNVGLRRYSAQEHFIDFEAEWNATIEAVAGIGLDLPLYRADGAMFMMDVGATVRLLRPLDLARRARRVAHIRQILRELDLIRMVEAQVTG